MNKIFGFIASILLGLTLVGCDKSEQAQTLARVASDVNTLKNQATSAQGQSVVLNVQKDARNVARAVVGDIYLRQFSACAEVPARLERINNYGAYSQVAQLEYVRACREQVTAGKQHDREAKIAARKTRHVAQASAKHKKTGG